MSFVYFASAYIATIVVTRIWLHFYPRHTPKVGNVQPHHYMFGLVLVLFYFVFPNIFLLAIGLGLIIDEIPLMFIFKGLVWPHNHWKEYRSKTSTVGICAISAVLFIVLWLYVW